MVDRPLTRRAIAALARDPDACSLAAIDAALAALDLERAVAIAIARVKSGAGLAIPDALPILLQIQDVTLVEDLIAIASGDRAQLLAGVDRGVIGKDSAARDVLLVFLAWRAGADRAEIIRHARRLSRAKLDGPGYVLLAELAAKLDDPHLTSATKHVAGLLTAKNKLVLADLDAALARDVDAIIATFPETDDTPRSQNFTIRAAAKPGRNELCHCGSGKKYKKCHADQDDAAGSSTSPIPGLGWDAYVTTAGDKMSVEDIRKLELPDLARLALAQLSDRVLVALCRDLRAVLAWDRASLALDELARRDVEMGDGHRHELVMDLLSRDELDRAEAELAKLSQPDTVSTVGLELDLRRGRLTLAQLEERARAVLADDKLEVDFAYVMMAAYPALGVLLARGCLRAGRLLDAETLLERIEEVRDELALPPDDVGWDMIAHLEKPAGDEDDDDGETEATRVALQATTSKIEQLERELEERKRQLDQRASTSTTVAPLDPAQVRALKQKVEALEGQIREGNTERGDLRRQLAVASRSLPKDAPATATETEEADDGDELEIEVRDIAIPSFERRVRDALDDVPQNVAADAMRTIGMLSSGDAMAWARVKQAKDMSRQVLMARIGIHHRLIFRVEDMAMTLIDLVTREDLLTTLKRIRANKT